jgi:hypothetical protein
MGDVRQRDLRSLPSAAGAALAAGAAPAVASAARHPLGDSEAEHEQIEREVKSHNGERDATAMRCPCPGGEAAFIGPAGGHLAVHAAPPDVGPCLGPRVRLALWKLRSCPWWLIARLPVRAWPSVHGTRTHAVGNHTYRMPASAAVGSRIPAWPLLRGLRWSKINIQQAAGCEGFSLTRTIVIFIINI